MKFISSSSFTYRCFGATLEGKENEFRKRQLSDQEKEIKDGAGGISPRLLALSLFHGLSASPL